MVVGITKRKQSWCKITELSLTAWIEKCMNNTKESLYADQLKHMDWTTHTIWFW